MTWVRLDVAILSTGLWSDLWASRLLIWFLCQAQVAATRGVVLFSYPVAASQIAIADGRTPREPSRKVLRRALRWLVAMGLVWVEEWDQGWEQARDVGGAQGYLTVRFAKWPPEGIQPGPSGIGPSGASGTGLVGDRAPNGYTKKREREQETLSESSSTRDPSRVDALPAEGTPERCLLDALRSCVTRFLAHDRRADARWARAQVCAFPAVDLVAEVRKADAWCTTNPARAGRRKSAVRFLGAWFRRANEASARSPGRYRTSDIARPSPTVLPRLQAALLAAEAERTRVAAPPQIEEPHGPTPA